MPVRDFLTRQTVRWLQDPRVMALMDDPRVSDGLVQALRWRSRAQRALERRTEALAGRLDLATKKEVRELRRTLRRLENELARARGEGSGP